MQAKRKYIWNRYYEAFAELEKEGKIRRPIVPEYATNNAHMFYLLFNDLAARTSFIAAMKDSEILTPFHYVPLHSAPAGKKYCRTCGDLKVTNKVSETLVRLPLYFDMTDEQIDTVIANVLKFCK